MQKLTVLALSISLALLLVPLLALAVAAHEAGPAAPQGNEPFLHSPPLSRMAGEREASLPLEAERPGPFAPLSDRGEADALGAPGVKANAPVVALADASRPEQPDVEHNAASVSESPPATLATMPYTILVDVQSSPPETLDPHWLYLHTSSLRVAAQVYETLLTHRREDPVALVPQLATGWQYSADGKILTFTLHSGITFHEGGTLEAHDVAYSAHRSLLQGRMTGPQWMAYEALFGSGLAMDSSKDFARAYIGKASFEELTPAELVQVCQAVKAAVVADDAAGTVTFHLYAPMSWFLEFLTTPYLDGVTDMEWMVANGDWDGNCATWQNWADPPPEASLLYDRMNGTGPFRFAHWTADEIKLVRFDGYWRSEPAWNEGPAGPAALEAVILKYVADWETRRTMLANGQADLVSGQADLLYVPSPNYSELVPLVWGEYRGFEDQDPTLVHPVTGTLRLFKDLRYPGQTAMMFCYDINADTNPYIGSGALDGNGIPPDFFTDIHVRKAFNYAMDWSRVISDIYGGNALQARGPIPAGMLGYADTQPTYFYSPTLSQQEFQQAWSGQVWSQGFSLTLAYDEGNILRQRMAEILAQNIEAISNRFHVNVISQTWPAVLDARRSRRLPICGGGWLEDYHHPHNWVQSFLYSRWPYGNFQSFPPALATQFDDKIGECAWSMDLSAAQTCYEELQSMSYVNTTAIWGVQTLQREYVRTEVRGYYFNPAIPFSPYYYALSKGAPPTVETVSPTVSSTLHFSHTTGAATTVQVPAGAVSETSEIVCTPDVAIAEGHPGGLRLAGLTFDLQVCQGGECLADYTFNHPVTATLHYQDADVAGVIEDELYLYTWNGSAWLDAVLDCGWPLTTYGRFPDENRLVVPLCHATQFALVGGTRNVYLPVVMRRR